MATVCLTFDVDAEAGLGAQLETSRHRLGTLTEHEFSVRRGLPRIVDLLGEHGMRGTFYVPGATAQRHPEAIGALVQAGHEVAHHGHHHLASHELDAGAQEAEIDEGLAALRPFLGEAFGYRSPAWELTPETADLLVTRGFIAILSLNRHEGTLEAQARPPGSAKVPARRSPSSSTPCPGAVAAAAGAISVGTDGSE
jgi:peptidoglycan/xylan/chitin deacetylase (PgdA/CDA1 family)